MAFETPSDRFAAGAWRFFALESFDSPRLIRRVWLIALAYYGAVIVMVAFGTVRSLIEGSDSAWEIFRFHSVTRLVQVMVLSVGYLLLIGIVLTACERTAVAGVHASRPTPARGLPFARASSRSIRTVWLVILAYYGLLLILGLIDDIRGAAYMARTGGMTWLRAAETYIGSLLQTVVSPVPHVLVIGSALRACDRVLRTD